MTNLPSGNTRTSPIAGSIDGFDTDLRTALAKLDRERRSSFARPGQRAEALERFTDAVAKALGKVRGQDRVAALADRKDALDRAAVSTAKTITALERQLATAVAEAAKLREALVNANVDLGDANTRWAEHAAALETELTETRASLAAAQAMGRDTAPVSMLEAPAPPVAPTMTPDGPRNDADASGLPVRTPGKGGHVPRRTGRPGGSQKS